MDVRPGGEWRFVSRDAEGNEFAFHGVYREITPPERLSYTFEFEGMPGYVSLETVSLEERDGKTTLTNTVAFHTPEDRDGMLASGMESGATDTMDRFEELLGRLIGTPASWGVQPGTEEISGREPSSAGALDLT